VVGAASTLNGYHERDGLAFGRFVQADRLLDSIVFHDEVFDLQAVDG